jgi:polar amino acid transport system permease protein
MNYAFDYTVIFDNLSLLLLGCLQTLALSVAAIAGALACAVLLSAGLRFYPRQLRWPVTAFVEAVRNTPFLVQLYFLFFGLPALGIRIAPTPVAIAALMLNGAAYATEILRGGLESIAKGQTEAGLALGLRPFQVYRYVVLTPALRAVFPSLASQFIFLMLTSSIVSSISANELTHVAAVLEGQTFRSFEIYFAAAVLYLAMSLLLSLGLRLIARRAFSYPG